MIETLEAVLKDPSASESEKAAAKKAIEYAIKKGSSKMSCWEVEKEYDFDTVLGVSTRLGCELVEESFGESSRLLVKGTQKQVETVKKVLDLAFHMGKSFTEAVALKCSYEINFDLISSPENEAWSKTKRVRASSKKEDQNVDYEIVDIVSKKVLKSIG